MREQKGFTLIELIIVIVILGIISVSTFAYLGFGAQIFRDTVERSALASEGRFVIERFSREVRNALPGSVRVAGDCVEYAPIFTSSLYLSLPTSSSSSVPFEVANSIENKATSTYAGRRVFVYANTESHIYDGSPSDARWHEIQAATIDASVLTFDIDGNVFGRESPAQRYFVTGEPVSWCRNGQTLVRFENYGWQEIQSSVGNLLTLCAAEPSCSSAIMARGVSLAPGRPLFQVEEATLRRNALIEIDFQVERAGTSEVARFNHEVHLPNVP